MNLSAIQSPILGDSELNGPKPKQVAVRKSGPGGGKSTFMKDLRGEDPEGRRWILVPEAAPLLFQAGFSAHEKAFQAEIALEDACAKAARVGAVLVCHRGALDPLAYWLAPGWSEDEFFQCIGFKWEELLGRCTALIHLQTAAVGAETFYRLWPDAHHPETPQQAAQIDSLCASAWGGHRHYVSLENFGRDWRDKSQKARTALTRCLGSSAF
jgi:hypothetical protein